MCVGRAATLSNVRSSGGRSRGDEPLPIELPAERPVDGGGPRPVRPRERDTDGGRRLHRLAGSHLTSQGLPPGSELLVDPRRPRRAEVALVRSGGRLRVGVFDLELGRAVLRSDRGTRWLDQDAVYLGVASVVSAPLEGTA